MEPERPEVYERIPWDTIEKGSAERQWLYVGLAGAIALGALAYTFMKSQPPAPPPVSQQVPATVPATLPTAIGPTSTLASPVVVAEADLYAIAPQRLVEAAAAHAEWFAVEYFTVDGSEESRTVLRALLPSGIPLPEAPEGIQVFVDWVRAQRVAEPAPLTYEVDVLVRSLLSTSQEGFVRQPVRMARVEVAIGDDGNPRVSSAPILVESPLPPSTAMALRDVPDEVIERSDGRGSLVGGVPTADGGWRLTLMVEGPDGVTRPETLIVR